MSEEKPKPAGRTSLVLVALVCVAPFVASFAAYYFWQPASRINYGELLAPVQLSAPRLTEVGGAPFELAQLRGKWAYLTVDSGRCDAYCQHKLWTMRQVRRTQGKHMERIERVWLLTDAQAPDAQLLAEHHGARVLRAAGSSLLTELPFEGAQRDHIYLVDPLGNLVLRYPRGADPSRMKKDLERLLKVSRIG